MMIIRMTVASLVFLLFFISSFALSGKHLDNNFYYEALDRLLEYEDDMENTLILDLQKALIAIESHEVDGGNICKL